MLSFWLKGSAAVSFKIAVKSIDLATTYYENTFQATPRSSNFELIRKVVPITSAPASFVIELSGQALARPTVSSSTLTPAIDDVAFLPEAADIVSNTYDYNPSYDVVSVTNAQNITSFREYDKLGREKFTYDQDKNVVLKNSYSYHQPLLKLSASFTVSPKTYLNQPITFKVLDNCIGDVKYEWDFGTGTYVEGSAIMTYAFTVAKNHMVWLRVTHPTLGQVSDMKVVLIEPQPLSVSICINGFSSYGCGDGMDSMDGMSPVVECADKPVPTNGTYFYAAVVGESIPAVTYQWKIRYARSNTWKDVEGLNSDRYAVADVFPHSQSFHLKCRITTPDGRVGETNAVTMNITTCAQN